METQLQIQKAAEDSQVQAIADLAAVIWAEHFTPIIGEKQVAYMVDKFQSYPALTQQIQDGYEYYQFFDDGEF